MKKLSVGLLLAAGLFFIDVSPAAAHHGGDRVHDRVQDRGYYQEPGRGYYHQMLRRHEMPRWLRRNANFRHWYRHSPLRHYRQIGWQELLHIYRAERRYFRTQFGFIDGPPGPRRGRDGNGRRNQY